MKYLSVILACIFLFSCTVTKYREKFKNNDFSQIQNGKTYIFLMKDHGRTTLKISSQDATRFYGTAQTKEVSINKSDISKIKQANLPLTISLIVGSALVVGLATSAILHAANVYGDVLSGH